MTPTLYRCSVCILFIRAHKGITYNIYKSGSERCTMWGIFGPLRFKTTGGGHISFFGVWLIVPSLALLNFKDPVEKSGSQENSQSDDVRTDRGRDIE